MTNTMAVNAVRVRQTERKTRTFPAWLLYALSIATVAFALAGLVFYDLNYGRLGIIGPQPIVEAAPTGRLIKVPPGGNVQAAIEMAKGGDIVELQAGAVYSGTINLPNLPHTEFVTIQSSAVSNLPADKRVTPAQRIHMATITAGILGRPAVSATTGAHHYRFIGIEFTNASSIYNYGLVQFGNGESADRIPHTLEIDRSYIRPTGSGKVRRGVALNSANTTVKNSYIEGIGFPGEETQGICGWTGTRNVKIINNYIEGGAENIMFGGADPDSADLIPSDIEVRGNHLNKPEAWQQNVSVKTLFELKNSKRVKFVGNLLTNNWKGSAFRITVRNQDDGAPFSIIEDTLIKDNIIDGAGDGINILGKDDTYPSRVLTGLTIENNLFLNIGPGPGIEGSGNFIQVADGEKITIARNTAFNSGSIFKFYGVMPRDFVFRDNIVNHGDYGVHGIDNRSEIAKRMIRNNLILNLNKVSEGDYAFPAGNTFIANQNEVGFADAARNDFRLSPNSKFRGKASDGGSPGSDLAAVR